MLGDGLDPTTMTARVGFGTASDTREGSMHCAKRGLANEVKCVVGLRRERRNATRQPFPETKNVRHLTDYNAAIVIYWGIKRTLNVMKLGRRSIYTKIRPDANFQPIPRTFSSQL